MVITISFLANKPKEKTTIIPKRTYKTEKVKPSPPKWSKGYFTDDFGDRTNETFIKQTVEGEFRNSATNGDKLYVKILVTNRNVGLFMQEYNQTRSPEKFIGGGSLMMKNEKGETVTSYSIGDWNHSGGLSLNWHVVFKFLSKSVGDVKFVVRDNYSSQYTFTINANGFNNAFKSM